ncbi:MAG: hypothetical protein MJE68_33140, partial [Proteobacteria bacterium]|nr:hypothetical protein [Pseudomonadota bacterium]
MDVLDKLSTRRKTYDRVEYVPQPRKRKQRVGDDDDSSVPVSPYRTTSTEAVDTEEGQEITKYIKEKTHQKGQQALSQRNLRSEGPIYDVPRPMSIPIPDSKRDWSKSFERPASERVRSPESEYEELGLKTRSTSQTPRYFNKTQEVMDTVKKAPMPSGQSAFVNYRDSVLESLDRQTPRIPSRLRRTLSETHIPPMVYGITPEESSSERGRPTVPTTSDTYIPMSRASVGLQLPKWMDEVPVCTTREPLTQFTQTIQGSSVITVPAMTLVTDEVKATPSQKQIEPDFYLPGGNRLSHSKTYQLEELTPERNPAIMVRLPTLRDKYQTDMFMLDRLSGHLYVP